MSKRNSRNSSRTSVLEKSADLEVEILSFDSESQRCTGTVASSKGDNQYHVSINTQFREYKCNCPSARIRGETCKHVVALMFAARRKLQERIQDDA